MKSTGTKGWQKPAKPSPALKTGINNLDPKVIAILQQIYLDKVREQPNVPIAPPEVTERLRQAVQEYDEVMMAQKIMEKVEKGG